MHKKRILVVDDDPDILRITADNLELDGYRVSTATTGREALRTVDDGVADLLVLDLTLPDIDGIQICRRVRETSDVPIIMLTARDRVPDKVLGLEAGADDYLVKPFDYLELAARIKACLRRYRPSPEEPEVIEVDDVKIDTVQRSVWRGGQKVRLTQREFALILVLARNGGRPVDRAEIRRSLWPDGELYSDSRAIDVHIQHLRSKLEDDPGSPQVIVTVPGVGYMLPKRKET